MSSVRPAFNVRAHKFTLEDLKGVFELEIEPTQILHALNVGNNLSIWFTDGEKVQSADLYGPEVVELVNPGEGEWRVVHARNVVIGEGVEVWLADLNSAETPESRPDLMN